MATTLSFTSITPIRTHYQGRNHVQSLRCARHAPLVCTLAPQRLSDEKKVEKKFRVVPADSDASLLPPPPPRHYSVPVLGFFLERMLKMQAMPFEKKDKYGPIFISTYFIGEMVHVLDYDTIVDIFRSPDVFTVGGAIKGLEEMFPGNLLSLDGEEHTKQRALFSPAFAKTLLSSYYAEIQERCTKLWENVLDSYSRDKRVVLDPFFRLHYLGFIINLSTGLHMNSEELGNIRKLFQAIQLGTITYLFGPLSKPAYKAQAELHQFLRTVVLDSLAQNRDTINELRKYGDGFGKREAQAMKAGTLNLLIVLLATSSLSTDPDAVHDDKEIDRLAYNISGTWLAGYATTSTTSMSSIFELGFNTDIQERLREEQESVIAAHNGERDVTYEQVMREMPLLDSFVTEVIRVHPAGGSMIRVANKDVEIMGHFVRRGTLVNLDFLAGHTDESIFPDAHQLIPDRFMHGKTRHILSFGAPGSAHYCSGSALAKMQLKCLLSNLLRNYNFALDEKQSREFRYVPEISPKSGVVLSNITKRHS